MKKVLALVLAVMMLATVAFAADTTNPGDDGIGNDPSRWKPGKTIKITALGIIKETNGAYNFIDSGKGEAGEDFKIIKDLNSTNYTIQSVKYDDGKAMVSGVSFNDKENRVEIKLKKDFTTTKGKKLDMTFTLKGKKVGKTKPANIEVRVTRTINYYLDEKTLIIDPDNELPKNLDFSDDTVIYKVKPEKNAAGTTIGASYGTLEFTANGDDEVDVEVRVYDGDELYLYSEADADDDILKAYADADADITFLSFTGEPTFNSTATVRFYKDEDSYIYGIKDGKLTNVNAKWDDDEGCFILKARTLGSYVFSDKKLSVSAGSDSAASNNPDTGANDVVGIATALAAVALVSAAAVSLKK